jgi:hypothetical protein
VELFEDYVDIETKDEKRDSEQFCTADDDEFDEDEDDDR